MDKDLERWQFINRMSDLQWDDETLRVIPLKDRQSEISLYDTKWWDYRDLHPAKATAMFAAAYHRALECSTERRGSFLDLRVKINPFDEVPVRAIAFWRARKFCDEHGFPYDFYCNVFFGQAEDYFPKMPRPQEMWRKDVAMVVYEAWQNLEESGQIQYPTNPLYHVRYNWDDKPCQHAWEEYYLKRLMEKPREVRQLILELEGKYIRDDAAALAMAA